MTLNKERAWDALNRLAFNRVSATEDELKAAELLKAECEKVGVKAEIEPFDVPWPTVSVAKFEVMKPEYKEIYCTGQGFSGNTGEEGICGPLKYVHAGEDEYLTDVKGCICLVTGSVLQETRDKLVKAGAIGYICTWGGLYDDEIMVSQVPHRHAFVKDEDKSNLPGVMMNLLTAHRLMESKPEEVKLTLVQDPTTSIVSRNVVATIEGTDPRLKEEVVVFSAHYDSVEFSDGAWDNATGSITLLELMHHYNENKPKRTVKFVWCGSEEIGLLGSMAYVKSHKDELKSHILNINFDMTGVLFGDLSMFGSCDDIVVKSAQFFAKQKGTVLKGGSLGLPSTDSCSFALFGVPAVTFGTMSARGGKEIHSRRDTMDFLDADAFIASAQFACDWSETIVNAVMNPVPTKIPEKVMERKAWWIMRLGLSENDLK